MNCVGFRNYKFFFLFCLYAFLVSLVYCIAALLDFISREKDGMTLEVQSGALIFIFCNVITISFCFSLLFFVGIHLKLILANQTTIEYGISRSDARGYNSANHFWNYDLGKARNFRAVFGDNMWLAWIPIANWRGDGYSYEVSNGSEEDDGLPDEGIALSPGLSESHSVDIPISYATSDNDSK